MKRSYAIRVRSAAALCVAASVALSGCEAIEEAGAGPSGASGGGPAVSDGRSVSPLENPEGTKPGLAPLSSDADRAEARKVIERLETKGRGPRTGYEREEFGSAWLDSADGVPFARNGCDTRNDLLRRDGTEVEFRKGSDCVVVAMTLNDPYTGKVIAFRKQDAMDVQVDHMVPLSYAWQMGAARWPGTKRRMLANDTLNLLPVDGRTNSAKRDSGPASWLPPSKGIRCAYSVRFALVALDYEMPVTAPDKAAMLRQCGG